MVFSSLVFLFAFLPAALICFYVCPKKLKNTVLMLTSLLFYAWGEPVFVILMVFSMAVNYHFGVLMEDNPAYKKQILVFTVCIDLALIAVFKYSGFAIETVNAISELNIPVPDISLPIGISFYTFQAISYIVDLYRNKYSAQRNFINFAAYISMFPQLIAGPIVRYDDVYRDLDNHSLSVDAFGKGAVRFIIGLGKKVLLANLAGTLFDSIHALGTDVSCLSAWLAAIAYTFQIYFDFSGYSDMAIGLGYMLGFHFPENFKDPYLSSSVTEFWRRWHISLSSWFKEYVYIPLGGNRAGAVRHISNILIVWLLTGLWHGAAWNFIIWGFYYGLILLWEKYIFSLVKCPAFLGRIFTLVAVIFGWVIFTADNAAQIPEYFSVMTGLKADSLADDTALYYLASYWKLLALETFFCLPYAKNAFNKLKYTRSGAAVAATILGLILVLCVAYLVTQNYNPFLYFQF